LTILIIVIFAAQAVAANGSTMDHHAMQYAAKVLATTMVNLYLNPEGPGPIREEFEESREDFTYEAYIPDGPLPIPADR